MRKALGIAQGHVSLADQEQLLEQVTVERRLRKGKAATRGNALVKSLRSLRQGRGGCAGGAAVSRVAGVAGDGLGITAKHFKDCKKMSRSSVVVRFS